MNDIVIYTTGDKQHGLGHVKRMIVLAWVLVKRGLSVRFVSEPGTLGWRVLAQTAMPVVDEIPSGKLVIIDVEDGPEADFLRLARALSRRLVTVYGGHSFPLRDPSADAAELLSDLVICQSIFKFNRGPHVLQGAEYLIIDPRYAANKFDPGGPILVVMGGTDPHNLTPRICDYFDRVHIRYCAPMGKPDLVREMWGKSIFVGAQGMVGYEAVAAGLPCLLYGWVDNAVATADELERLGVARSMGLWSDYDERKLGDTLGLGFWRLKNGGPRLVDGQGAARVADRICQLLGKTA